MNKRIKKKYIKRAEKALIHLNCQLTNEWCKLDFVIDNNWSHRKNRNLADLSAVFAEGTFMYHHGTNRINHINFMVPTIKEVSKRLKAGCKSFYISNEWNEFSIVPKTITISIDGRYMKSNFYDTKCVEEKSIWMSLTSNSFPHDITTMRKIIHHTKFESRDDGHVTAYFPKEWCRY